MVRASLLVSFLFLLACGGSDAGGERAAGGTGGVDGTGGTGGTVGTGGTGGTIGEELPATVLDVTFPAEGITLEGSLHLPRRREGERVPAVILVHGSGPSSRDETMAGQLGMGFPFRLHVFAELAEALAEAGYAVLRYDKRTCGPFNGCADNGYPVSASDGATVDTFLADAVAGLDFLAGHEAIDPARLHLVGHSQGASFAPEVLGRRPAVRSGAMLAGPFRPIDVVMAAQTAFLRGLLRATGVPEAQIDQQLADLDRIDRELAELRAGTFSGASIGGVPVAFWAAWIALGEAAPERAVDLDRPLLALSGDYDWNVPVLEHTHWKAVFDSVDPPLHETKLLPCVTHALNCVSEPDWRRIEAEDIGRHVDAAVIDELLRFLDAAP